MTVPPPNRRTSDVERQLAAMASSRERANNPVSFLVLGVLALVVGLGFLGWSVLSLGGARSELRGAESRAQRWDQYLATIGSLSQSAPDIRRLYPILGFIKSDLEDIRDEIWANELPTVIVGSHQRKRVIMETDLEQFEIDVNVQGGQGVELDRLLLFIDRAMMKYRDRPAFVSQLTLRPMPSSPKWSGTVKFGNYQITDDFAKGAP